jgi:hypothetical protein
VSPSLEVFRFPSVGDAVARGLGIDAAPECRRENGRVILIFRRQGATRWSEAQQAELALRTANVARAVLAEHSRRELRASARRAIVVVYEDAAVVQGCAVTARWECVVPATS